MGCLTRTANERTWAEDRAENRKVVDHNVDRIEGLLVEINDVLQKRFQIVRPVVVLQSFVRAQFVKNGFDPQKAGVKGGQLGKRVLLEHEVILVDGSGLGRESL